MYSERGSLLLDCGHVAGNTLARARSLSNLREVVDHYARRVEALSMAILGDQHLAELASVEVFAVASRSPGRCSWVDLAKLSFLQCRKLRLWAVLRGVFARLFREVRRPDSTVIRSFQRLPWNERILLALREVAELPPDQIAAIVGETTASVKAGLLRGRLRLSESMRQK